MQMTLDKVPFSLMDVMTPSQRHRAMAHNRGRTGPERALASGLWRRGLRYFTAEGYKRITGKRLLGAPDLVFPRKQVLVFVDGCFWHGCLECSRHSGLRSKFWLNKIEATKQRDQRVATLLQGAGWMVIRIPEHNVRTKDKLAATVDRLVPYICAVSRNSSSLAFGENSV